MERNKNIAIILAGGIGSRLGLDKPKQFLKVAGKTVLEHTVDVFQKHEKIDEIAIVMHGNYLDIAEQMVSTNHWTKVKKILNGGSERYESSLSAIRAYEDMQKEIGNLQLIFHDSVRPLVSPKIITDVIEALNTYDAVDVAVPAVDTIITVNQEQHTIEDIPKRAKLNRGQTPQGFKYETIATAYEKAMQDKHFAVTDDCGIVLKYLPETPIYVVAGEERNAKLTYPEDIYLFDKLFQLKTTQLTESFNGSVLKDKVMVVFGGTSGIGADMVNLANQAGAHAYACSRRNHNVDIRDRAAVDKFLQDIYAKHKRIDYIVDSAAILNKEPLMHLDDATIDTIIGINYRGMVNISIAAYPYLQESKGCLLHFTSSSYTRGRSNYALYSSTKAAVVNFVQALAEEWEPEGIRVNCINPQRTKTPMRVQNFGIEPEESLLKSEIVAKESLKALNANITGEVIDIKLM